ncbi:MAG: hypothetical protein D3916_02860 [Candidatus Electrothrix sp. MAN1_4]|nr:hypothetical protein [Candidatus Electrothrix sp. MAN1_4]
MIWVIQHKKSNKFIRLTFLFISILAILLSYIIPSKTFLGSESWYNISPYREIIYFIIMILGMSARYITNAIEVRREKIIKLKKSSKYNKKSKVKLDLDVYEFSYPFFFSIITFGMLLKQIEAETITVSSVVLSFQNGFFWQTVLKKEIK